MDDVRGDGRACCGGVVCETGVEERTFEPLDAGVVAIGAPLAASLAFVTALTGRLSSLYTPESANERTWSARVAVTCSSSSRVCNGGAEFCSIDTLFFPKCTFRLTLDLIEILDRRPCAAERDLRLRRTTAIRGKSANGPNPPQSETT